MTEASEVELTPITTVSVQVPAASEKTASKDCDDDVEDKKPCCDIRGSEFFKVDRALLKYKSFFFFFLGAIGSVFPYFSVYFKQLGFSPNEIGIISGVRPLVGFFSGPLWGSIADRFRIRRIMLLISALGWLSFITSIGFVPPPKYDPDCAFVNVLKGNITHETYSGPTPELRPDATPDETLQEDRGWMFDTADLHRVFITILILVILGEVVQSPTGALADSGCVEELGSLDMHKYGHQRAWGSLSLGLFMLLQTITTLLIVGIAFKEFVCNTISPYPTAYVLEYDQTTFECAYSGERSLLMVSWDVKGIIYALSIDQQNHSCTTFGHTAGINRFQFNCSKDTFYWTILNVTRQDHGKWTCNLLTAPGSESNATMLFVKVPAKSISFSSPQGDPITVVENEDTPFICSTSEERPRSTIQWYIKNEAWSLGTGKITPIDNSLAETKSEFNFNFNRSYNQILVYCSVDKSAADGLYLKSTERQIIIQFPPEAPRIKVGTQQILGPVSVIKGDNVNATCESTSEPGPPSYQWSGQAATGSLLTISNIQTSTTRTCTAKNTMSPSIPGRSVEGSSSISFIIDVLTAPTTPKLIYISQSGTRNMLQDSELAVIKGAAFSVECSGSTSNPSPHNYSWTGKIVSQTNSISFSTADTNDAGQYACHVVNTMVRTFGATETGKSSRLFTMSVLFPPETPRIKVGTEHILGPVSVIKGDNVNATCESTSEPGPPSYQWSVQAATGSLLTINNIQTSTTRTCTVKNTMSPSIPGGSVEGSSSVSFKINVLTAPTTPKLIYISESGTRYMLSGSELALIKGTTFSVECSGSTSNPNPPNYNWTGNKVSHTNTISFSTADTNDAGQYICHVENIMVRTFGATETGKNSRAFNISVLHKPAIQPLLGQTVTENSRLSVTCTATGNPGPIDYKWTRSKDSFQKQTSTLIINSTSREDTDIYTCTAKNRMIQTFGDEQVGEDTASMSVKILYGPENVSFSPSTAEYIKREGDLLNNITCVSDCSPGCTYIWNNGSADVSRTNTLSLGRLHWFEAATYFCMAKNYATGVTMERNLTLHILHSPRPVAGTNSVITATQGTTVILSLTVLAYPVPNKYVWYKWVINDWIELYNFATVETTRTSLQFNLTISSFKNEDYGEYKLTVDNGVENHMTYVFTVKPSEDDTETGNDTQDNTGLLVLSVCLGALLVISLLTIGVLASKIFLLRKGRMVQGRYKDGNSSAGSGTDDVQMSTFEGTNASRVPRNSDATNDHVYDEVKRHASQEHAYGQLGSNTGSTPKTYENFF